MDNTEQIWGQIDHGLAELKIHAAIEQFNKLVNGKLGDMVLDEKYVSSSALLVEWYPLYKAEEDRLIENIFQIYKEVWKIQGKEVTPQFIRAIYQKVIVPWKSPNIEYIHDLFKEHSERRESMAQFLKPMVDYYPNRLVYIREQWFRRCEIEALELEHIRSNNEKLRAADVVNPQNDESKIDNSQKATARRIKRIPDLEVNKRRRLIQSIAESSPKSRRKNLDLLTAQELDGAHIDIQEKWYEYDGVNSWVNALKHPELKDRVQKMFSSDRNKQL